MTVDQYPVSIISWPPRAVPDDQVETAWVMKPGPGGLTIGDLYALAYPWRSVHSGDEVADARIKLRDALIEMGAGQSE